MVSQSLRLPMITPTSGVGKLGVEALGVEAWGVGALDFTGSLGKKGLAEAKDRSWIKMKRIEKVTNSLVKPGYNRVARFSKVCRAILPEGSHLNFDDWLGDDAASDSERVRLMHHDARWRQEFEQTRSGILQSCEGRVVAVEHIGSTAIGGIIARPVIDAVAVVADPVDLHDAALLIEGLNFRVVELPQWVPTPEPPRLVLEKPRHGETTHRVFVVNQGSRLLEKTTRLRDYLRANPAAAIEFEEAKVNVWKETEGHFDAYHHAMSSIFDEFYSR